MIDLHTHILHDIDDGARTLTDALSMARAAVADGVTVIAATPHGRTDGGPGLDRYSVALARERVAELRAALATAAIPLDVVLGTELYGGPGLVERLQAGELLTYGEARAVFLEFPPSTTFVEAETRISQVQLAGYQVVVAHPERYRFVQEDPGTLRPFIKQGALMQLTCDALLGVQGEYMRSFAELLLAEGFIHLLASDAHGPHVGRMPNLGAARSRASELVGEAAAECLARHTPAAILAGCTVPRL